MKTLNQIYRVLAGLVALGVVAQAMFIAYGTFGLNHTANNGGVVDAGALDPEHATAFSLHALTGYIIALIALLLFGFSFAARQVHHRIRWALTVFLAVAVQVQLAYASYDTPVIGLFHGGLALVIFGAALRALLLPIRPIPVPQPAPADVETAQVP
jgi:hypothetical protein